MEVSTALECGFGIIGLGLVRLPDLVLNLAVLCMYIPRFIGW